MALEEFDATINLVIFIYIIIIVVSVAVENL